MHFLKVAAAFLGLVTIGLGTGTDLACNTVATIFVTVFATDTVTETVERASSSVHWAPSVEWSTVGPSQLTGSPSSTGAPDIVTTTLETVQTSIIYQVFTSNVGVVAVSSSGSDSSASGLYSFFVGTNGITAWLGGQTPPATESQVTATVTVVIEPQPSSSWVSSTEKAQTISIETVTMTSVFTDLLTETLTVSSPVASISTSPGTFNGIGPYGWNVTTLQRVKVTGSGPGHYLSATSASSVRAPQWTKPSSGLAPAPSVWYHPHEKRQVGAVVTATINGVVVSWTNSYDGAPKTVVPYSATSKSALPGTPTSVPLDSVISFSTAGAVPLEPPSHSVPDLSEPTIWATSSSVGPNTPSSNTAWQVPTIWATSSSMGPSTPFSDTVRQVPTVEPSAFSSDTAPTAMVASIAATSSSIEVSAYSVDTFSPPPTFSATSIWVPPSATSVNATWPTSTMPVVRESVSTTAMWYPLSLYSTTPILTLSVVASPATPSLNGTSTASPVASPTACNIPDLDIGNSTITFEDLPTFAGFPGDADYPPIMSPYRNMYWSQGFAYAPPPTDPFVPVSGSKLAVFVTNSSANVHPENTTHIPGPGDDVDGEFGAGPNFADSAFWFNAYSAYVGCANAGPLDCMMTINGYGYDPVFKDVTLVARQTAYQSPCIDLINCSLMPVTFSNDFRNLTAFQIIASVGSSPLLYTWYMDNFAMGWSDNSCAAGHLRATSEP